MDVGRGGEEDEDADWSYGLELWAMVVTSSDLNSGMKVCQPFTSEVLSYSFC